MSYRYDKTPNIMQCYSEISSIPWSLGSSCELQVNCAKKLSNKISTLSVLSLLLFALSSAAEELMSYKDT